MKSHNKNFLRVVALSLLTTVAAYAQWPNRVSESPTGGISTGITILSGVSADGRWAFIEADGDELAAGDVNLQGDIIAKNMITGETSLLSRGLWFGQQFGIRPGEGAASSADGRIVAFVWRDPGVAFEDGGVPDTNTKRDVYLLDRDADGNGVWDELTPGGRSLKLISRPAGAQGDGAAGGAAVSADGRWIAYHSDSENLVPGDTNGAGDIFVYDRVNGTTVRVSVASDGTQQDNWTDLGPVISPNGRFVAFESLATNLVPGDTNNAYDVFIHDRDADGNGIYDETGPGQRATIRVSQRADGGQVNGSPSNLDPNDDHIAFAVARGVSDDGRRVVFSHPGAILPGDAPLTTDVYMLDRDANGDGVMDDWSYTNLAPLAAAQGGSASGFINNGIIAANVSPNLRWMTVTSGDPAFIANYGGDPLNVPQLTVLRDLLRGEERVIDQNPAGALTDFPAAFQTAIANNGLTLVTSLASNIMADDTNLVEDVFVYDPRFGVSAAAPAIMNTTMPLHFRAEGQAGKFYQAACMLNWNPGVRSGPHFIPLAVDDMFIWSAILGVPNFGNFRGVLDANGEANGYIVVPVVPGMSGFSFYTGFVVADFGAPFDMGGFGRLLTITIQ